MKKIAALLLAAAGIISAYIIINDNSSIPKGWFAAGNKLSEYEMGVDNSVFQNGKSCAFIKSTQQI